MPPIQGWKKVSDTRWEQRNADGFVTIDQLRGGANKGDWRVQFKTGGSSVGKRTYRRKKDALEYARKWMRSHPGRPIVISD